MDGPIGFLHFFLHFKKKCPKIDVFMKNDCFEGTMRMLTLQIGVML